eukprot:4833810-Alexandrium_andersonii.AAC.1
MQQLALVGHFAEPSGLQPQRLVGSASASTRTVPSLARFTQGPFCGRRLLTTTHTHEQHMPSMP